jgi:hypothetical protein
VEHAVAREVDEDQGEEDGEVLLPHRRGGRAEELVRLPFLDLADAIDGRPMRGTMTLGA